MIPFELRKRMFLYVVRGLVIHFFRDFYYQLVVLMLVLALRLEYRHYTNVRLQTIDWRH